MRYSLDLDQNPDGRLRSSRVAADSGTMFGRVLGHDLGPCGIAMPQHHDAGIVVLVVLVAADEQTVASPSRTATVLGEKTTLYYQTRIGEERPVGVSRL